jgi:hypothetical protein
VAVTIVVISISYTDDWTLFTKQKDSSRFSHPGFLILPVFPFRFSRPVFSRPGFPGANPRGPIFRLGFREEKKKVPDPGIENGNGKIRVLNLNSRRLLALLYIILVKKELIFST